MNMLKTLSLLAVALACLFVPSSCIGSRAKPAALFPPAALTWPAVSEDLSRGIADGVEKGELSPTTSIDLLATGDLLGEAIEAHDLEGVRRVPWSVLEPWASRGIDDKLVDGEIGPGVAASLREQLSNFSVSIFTLQSTF